MARRNFLPSILAAGVTLFCLGMSLSRADTSTAEYMASTFSSANLLRVGDRLNLPRSPVTPGTSRAHAPVSEAQAGAAVTAGIAAKFAQAAGSTNNLLTKKAALASGWGWAADHFSQIDRQNKGKVSLNDVLDYINRRSSLTLPRMQSD